MRGDFCMHGKQQIRDYDCMRGDFCMHGKQRRPLKTACEAAEQTRLSYGKPARTNSFVKTIQTSRTNFFKAWREYSHSITSRSSRMNILQTMVTRGNLHYRKKLHNNHTFLPTWRKITQRLPLKLSL